MIEREKRSKQLCLKSWNDGFFGGFLVKNEINCFNTVNKRVRDQDEDDSRQ